MCNLAGATLNVRFSSAQEPTNTAGARRRVADHGNQSLPCRSRQNIAAGGNHEFGTRSRQYREVLGHGGILVAPPNVCRNDPALRTAGTVGGYQHTVR